MLELSKAAFSSTGPRATGAELGSVRKERFELDLDAARVLGIDDPFLSTALEPRISEDLGESASLRDRQFEAFGPTEDEAEIMLGDPLPSANEVGSRRGEQVEGFGTDPIPGGYIGPKRGVLPRAHRQLLPGVLVLTAELDGAGAQELDPLGREALLDPSGNPTTTMPLVGNGVPCPDQPSVSKEKDDVVRMDPPIAHDELASRRFAPRGMLGRQTVEAHGGWIAGVADDRTGHRRSRLGRSRLRRSGKASSRNH